MENKLLAPEAERDLICTAYTLKYTEIIKGLDLIIDKYFIKPFTGTCIRRWIQPGYDSKGGVYINFEIGFYNPSEGLVDFGSDMDFSYDSFKQLLEVNYGTCGRHSRHDEYQVKRVKTLAYVWDNIDNIETELNEYAIQIAPVILAQEHELYDIDRKISSIKQEINIQKKNIIEESIHVGTVIFYNENVSLRASQKLFLGTCEVVKTTPKFVVVKNNLGKVFRIRKEQLVSHAFNKYITVE